jgi:hypothetical protein
LSKFPASPLNYHSKKLNFHFFEELYQNETHEKEADAWYSALAEAAMQGKVRGV